MPFPVNVAGCKVCRGRFRGLVLHLYLPIPPHLWPQTVYWTSWLSVSPSVEWMTLSKMISDVWFPPLRLIQVLPCVLTLSEHCVTWEFPEQDNFIYECQGLGLHSTQWPWRLAVILTKDLGMGFRGLLSPWNCLKNIREYLGFMRIFPQVFKCSPNSQAGRDCCFGGSHWAAWCEWRNTSLAGKQSLARAV